MTRNPVTPEGYAELGRQLEYEKSVVRPGIVRDIEEARAHGDISENSEYEDAKERQALCEGRVNRLESLYSASEVIDVTKLPQNGRVVFGVWVEVENSEGESRTWRIVGETESDLDKGWINYKTPVAKALIGRSAGDEVIIPTPGGRQTWEVVQVNYAAP